MKRAASSPTRARAVVYRGRLGGIKREPPPATPAREFVRHDAWLRAWLEGSYNRGPDFVNPLTGRWYDMTTTREQFKRHVTRYREQYGTNARRLRTGRAP
jgi:hypothetical protein